MFGFFRRKKFTEPEAPVIPPPQYQAAPGTEIRFQPELVPQLKTDHQNLIGIYLDIKTAFEGGDYEEVAKKLVHFRSSLQAHLLTENVRLYIYLSHSLANDEINSELIHEFRREMDAIARVAMNFLKKYDTIGVDKELAGAFAKDFATIGQVLTERIEKEERVLYPLYLPYY